MWSSIVIVILVFAVLGILLGFSEAYGSDGEIPATDDGALTAYTLAIHPSALSSS